MKTNNRNVDKLFKLGINCCLMFWGNNKCFCFVSLLMSKGDVLLHCYSTVVTMLLIFIFIFEGSRVDKVVKNSLSLTMSAVAYTQSSSNNHCWYTASL